MRRAAIGASLRLETSQFKAAIYDAKRSATAFTDELKKMKSMGPGAGGGRGGGGGMFGGWTELSSKINLVGGALRNTAGAAAKASLDFDSMYARLGSAEKLVGGETIEKQLEELTKLAQKPGLGMKQVIEGATNLQMLGLSAADARLEMEAYGNAVARSGGSMAEFEQVMENIAQLRSGSGDLTDIKQIGFRIKGFRAIADSLMHLKDGTKDGDSKFMDAVREKLLKLPPAIKVARTEYDKLKDDVEAKLASGKIAAWLSGVASMGREFLKLEGKRGVDEMDSAMHEAVNQKTPFAKYQMSLDQLRKAAAAEKEEAKLVKEAEEAAAMRRKMAAEQAFRDESGYAQDMLEVEKQRRNGNWERAQQMEDFLEKEERALQLAKEYNITEAEGREVAASAIKQRRELNAEAAKLKEADAERDLKERNLRGSGRDRAADKMAADKKEADRVRSLIDGGSTPEAAKRLAGLERKADDSEAHFQRTGRRRIKGAVSANKKTGIGSTEFTNLDAKNQFPGLAALSQLQDDKDANGRNIYDSPTSKIAAYKREMASKMPRKAAAAEPPKDAFAGFKDAIMAGLSGIGMGKLPEQITRIVEALEKQAGQKAS